LYLTCKILLNPGSLSEAFDSSRVVSIAQNLDNQWRCVVHSAAQIESNDPYLRRLEGLNKNSRVIFSLNPVPYSQIDELLGSAQIGLVLYSSQLGQNTSSVGLASGKLSHFLKLGIPVIVSNLPGLADFVITHKVGAVLEQDDDLPRLLQLIDSDIDSYRERCIKCFNDYLSYEVSFQKIINYIQA
jgi:glycosyltransferase involved in cell wall biosynthesis